MDKSELARGYPYTPAKVERCGNPEWLRMQLEHWPSRVDQSCTANIEFLMKAAAAEIDFLTALQPEAASRPVVGEGVTQLVEERTDSEILMGLCVMATALERDGLPNAALYMRTAAAKIEALSKPMTDLPTRSEGIGIIERLEQITAPVLEIWAKTQDGQGPSTGGLRGQSELLARDVREAASHIRELEARIGELEEALNAAHYYIDASPGELADEGITRDQALLRARDARQALENDK